MSLQPLNECAGFADLFNALASKITDQKDKEICLKWYDRIQQVKPMTPRDRSKRKAFFKFLTQVMKQSFLNSLLKLPAATLLTPEEVYRLKEEVENLGDASQGECQNVLTKLMKLKGPNYKCHWSDDGLTYVAIQQLDGDGALVYMAACDPNRPGWIQND